MSCQHVNKDINYDMRLLGFKIHTSQFPEQTVIYDSPNYPCLMMVCSRNINEGTRAKGRQNWADLHMDMHDMTWFGTHDIPVPTQENMGWVNGEKKLEEDQVTYFCCE